MKKVRIIVFSLLLLSFGFMSINQVNAYVCNDVPGTPALNTGSCRLLDITVNGHRTRSLSCGGQIDQSPLDCIQPPQ